MSRAVDRAERRRLRAAVDAAEAAVDPAQAFERAQAVVLGVLEEIKALRAPLRHIPSGGVAAQTSPSVASAWAQYQEALRRWQCCHELARLLRGCGWLSALPRDAPRGASQFARYDRAVHGLELLDWSYDDAEPGLYTAEEVAAHIHKVEGERHAAAQRQAREAMGAGQG